jgi:hypothetical protein
MIPVTCSKVKVSAHPFSAPYGGFCRPLPSACFGSAHDPCGSTIFGSINISGDKILHRTFKSQLFYNAVDPLIIQVILPPPPGVGW